MKQNKWKGKVVIVTGSSRGIGKAVALLLAQKGAKVVINGRNPERLQAAGSEFKLKNLQVTAIEADIGNPQACEELIDQTIDLHGQLDILINNAGLSMEGTIADSQPGVFQQIFETNILGHLFPTQKALPHIVKTKGSIVFISSIAGLIGLPKFAAYSSSKMALTALTQSLRIENNNNGIHIGLNYLGFVENEENKTYLNEYGKLKIMPKRKGFAKMSTKQVSIKIIRGIELRQKNIIFSNTGRALDIAHRFFPGLLEYFMIKAYRKQQKNG